MAQMSFKPKPKTEPPWGSFDVPTTQTSTYNAAFVSFGPPRQREKIVPKPLWEAGKDNTRFDARSTAQDAFIGHGGGPRISCKPANNWETTAWMQPLSTTAGSHFIPYYGAVKREAIRPVPKERDASRFDTRSTAQDAYPAFASNVRPPKPFYPKEQDRVDMPFDHTSTSRAAFISHPVAPFVAAKKPKGAMDASGF